MSASVIEPQARPVTAWPPPNRATVPLRMAFVAVSYVSQRDGVSVYAENLLLEILREAPRQRVALTMDVYACEPAAAVLEEVLRREGFAERVQVIASPGNDLLTKYLRVPRRVRRRGPYQCVFVPNLQPLWLPAARTVGVLHDLTYRVASAYLPRWLVCYRDLLTRFWLLRGMTIGCISRTTLDDLERFYPASRGRPRPYLPNGLPSKLAATPRPDGEEAENKLAAAPLELIFVGRLNRLKGFDRVRDLCLRLDAYCAAHGIEANIHIVGKDTPESPELLTELRLPRVRLIRHGYVEDPALNDLYRHSSFCLFLSRNEGFGLPLLEAIWQRCVPLLSDISIFREVMGPDYPLFAGDAEGLAALANFMHRMRTDPLYRRETLARMDRVLAIWEGGYARSARSLLAWATGAEERAEKET